jgi:hypothetical protein
MRIHTDTLNLRQLNTEIAAVCKFFLRKKIKEVAVMYGWACNIEPEDGQWQNVTVSTDELRDYIKTSRNRGIFRVGDSDLWIAAPGADMEFVFGHESDLRFDSKNSALIDEVRSSWIARGIKGWGCFIETQPPKFVPWNLEDAGTQ